MFHTVDSDLASENEELLQFLYASPVGILQMACDGTVGLINPLAMQLLTLCAQTTFLTNFFVMTEACAPDLRNMVDDFRAPNGIVCENHHIFIAPATDNGGHDAKVLTCTIVKLGSGRLMVTLADVSRQIARDRRLKQAETWFASLLDSVNDFAVVSLDGAGRIDMVNPSVLRQTGFACAEMIGRRLDMFIGEEDGVPASQDAEKIAIARRDGWHLEEGWHRRKDGSRYWCQTLIAARGESDSAGEPGVSGYTVVLRDVTRQDSNTSRLRELLTTDHLTGAVNRAHFFDVAARECLRFSRHGWPAALIMMDVDHFKQVNDVHGHAAGDEALKAISAICRGIIRPTDTFARIGGEEFVVLLPSTSLQDAADIAERLRESIAATAIKIADRTLRCTASFGCAVLGDEVRILSELVSASDAALYTAKRSGRNRVVLATRMVANCTP